MEVAGIGREQCRNDSGIGKRLLNRNGHKIIIAISISYYDFMNCLQTTSMVVNRTEPIKLC